MFVLTRNNRVLQACDVNTIKGWMQEKADEQRELDYGAWAYEYRSRFAKECPSHPIRYDPDPMVPKKEPSAKFFHQSQSRGRTVYKKKRAKRWSKK